MQINFFDEYNGNIEKVTKGTTVLYSYNYLKKKQSAA